jgi:hypothetical protein
MTGWERSRVYRNHHLDSTRWDADGRASRRWCRWRDVLDADDLALYEEAKQRVLEPECAQWLEQGHRG